MKAKSEDRAEYTVKVRGDDALIAEALKILAERLVAVGDALNSPQAVKDYLRLTYTDLPHEVFGCLWLNSQNRLIKHEILFRGTLTQTSVYPREIVKAALACNAGAVILVHNHPSGLLAASAPDIALTGTLKSALALIDCKVIDHMIVAGLEVLSFAETGMI